MREIRNFEESRHRSLVKGLTWRIFATATTVSIAYLIKGRIDDALKIGAIEFVGKIFIYYLHERALLFVPGGHIIGIFDR